MARAAVSRRLTWRVATVTEVREETPSARTLVLDVPDWPGHLPGQHVDVRLTAPDGYSTQRSYSIASAWGEDGKVELTVQRIEDGEVSSYLTDVLKQGDPLEFRGPVGGWFVWRPDQKEPVLLVGGGSGVVPLMAVVRRHRDAGSQAPLRLLYSVRDPSSILFRDELAGLERDGVDVRYVFTRHAPQGWPHPPGRLDSDLLAASAFAPELEPTTYVCGPTRFVEYVADLLVAAGHDPRRVRTERFGPSGGNP
jgi:ferredoxin-NADP reductase